MKQIDSKSNPFYKSCKRILTASGIREDHRIMVSGRKIVPEFLKRPELRPYALIVSDPKQVELLEFPSSINVYLFKNDMFQEIDESGTHFPLLVLDAPKIPIAQLDRPPVGLEIVLALSNPQNLGAALRVCEAFEAREVILLKESAHPFLPKVIRGSSGSAMNVKLSFGPNIKELTEQHTNHMIALDRFGKNLMEFSWPKDCRLFLGEEGRGVPPEFNFHEKVNVPIKTGMDSLNAVSAISIGLFSYRTHQGY